MAVRGDMLEKPDGASDSSCLGSGWCVGSWVRVAGGCCGSIAGLLLMQERGCWIANLKGTVRQPPRLPPQLALHPPPAARRPFHVNASPQHESKGSLGRWVGGWGGMTALGTTYDTSGRRRPGTTPHRVSPTFSLSPPLPPL